LDYNAVESQPQKKFNLLDLSVVNYRGSLDAECPAEVLVSGIQRWLALQSRGAANRLTPCYRRKLRPLHQIDESKP